MLVLHVLLLLAISVLKLPELFLLLPQLLIQVTYLFVIVAFFVQRLEGFLLFSLDFQQRLVLVLQGLENSLLVL